LTDIEQFKTTLQRLGHEPEMLERWGETWTDIQPPEQGVPDDLAALLGTADSSPDGLSAILDSPDSATDDLSVFLDASETAEDDLSMLLEQSESGEATLSSSIDGSQTADHDLSTGPDLPESSDDALSDLLKPLDSMLDSLESSDDASQISADELASLLGPGDFPATILPDEQDTNVPEPDGEEESSDGKDLEPDSLETLPDFDDIFALGSPEQLDTSMAEPYSPPSPSGTSDHPEEPVTLEDGTAEEPATDLGADLVPDLSEVFDLGGDIFDFESPAESDAGTDSPELFDDFKLDDLQSAALPSASVEMDLDSIDFDRATTPESDIDSQLAAIEGELPTANNFNLDSAWTGDFSIPGFEMAQEGKSKPKTATAAIISKEPAAQTGEDEIREVKLSDAQVDALQDSLLSYPLNLRLAVEDIIANSKGNEAQQTALIWLMVERSTAREVAKAAGKILKKYIPIPSGMEKRTGAAFEASKGSLGYMFIHSVLPMLQVILLVAAGAGLLFSLGYNFIYRPIRASMLFTEGHKQIQEMRYRESEELFLKADRIWTMKSWHYRYAEAYADMNEFPRAESMYDRLLYRWPLETRAALDYARMVSTNLGFEKAETILKRHILERDYFNRDALLLLVDNYLAWADFEEQRYEGPRLEMLQGLYENARFNLATLMERHNRTDPYLQRMLTYFIRTERAGGSDKLQDVRNITDYIIKNPKSGFAAATLAELADYLMDRNQTVHVGALLMAALDRNGTLPEVYTTLAKWNQRSGFPQDELKSLNHAVQFYNETESRSGLTVKQIKGYLRTLIRMAEMLMAKGEALDANDTLGKAIQKYELSLTERRFMPNPSFAKAYSLLADLNYRDWRNFEEALRNYAKAEGHGYSTPESDYRRGYIHYHAQDNQGSDEALRMFYRAGMDREASPYLLLATGNTLLNRSNYFTAQGYYTMLVDRMQYELAMINAPSPQQRPSHREIVELLMVSLNNLGVTKYMNAERMGDARQRAEAMVDLMASSRLYDSMTRDQLSMIRSETRNLGFLNTDFILHPQRGIDLAIFQSIPMEMHFPAE
jgi:hypothetical protein